MPTRVRGRRREIEQGCIEDELRKAAGGSIGQLGGGRTEEKNDDSLSREVSPSARQRRDNR